MYLKPIKSDGTSPIEGLPGQYPLEAGTTYYYQVPSDDELFAVQLIGYTAGLVITSATIQDSSCDARDVVLISSTAGEWISETPSTSYVGTDGSGWTVTNGVVASAGSALGGALWHISQTGAGRTRLKVVVGGTGGIVRIAWSGNKQ
jgi:hypothetical protein